MKKIIYLSVLAIIFLGCEKDKNTKEFYGTYTGTFTTVVGGKITESNLSVLFSETGYAVTKSDIPASGNFKVAYPKTIVFNSQNAWLADFDWNLILNGSYTYKKRGDSLILDKLFPASSTVHNTYQYRLKKID